jgi:two-component system sensor histidine kinase AgrC
MKKILIYLVNLLLLIISIILVTFTNSKVLTIVTLIVLQIFTIFTTFLYQKNIIYKQKLEIENLNSICDSTRTFRHDFNNIMQAMGGYIKTNNIYDLKQYFNRIVPECFRINNLYRFHSKLMENTAIYSIISNKYNLAEKHNIKMSLNILTDLNYFKIDNYSLTKIIGILLDNAIEASSESQMKIVNLSFQSNQQKQLIIVENTYANKGISTKKIFEKNYSTKLNNSGLGLWEVRKIINSHKNLKLETKTNSTFFLQQLEIS